MTAFYRFFRADDGEVILQRIDRGSVEPKTISPASSLKVCNHSPTGFNFGYGGSGAAQLALAILLDYLDLEVHSIRLHQDFKRRFIANVQENEGRITREQIDEFLAASGMVVQCSN